MVHHQQLFAIDGIASSTMLRQFSQWHDLTRSTGEPSANSSLLIRHGPEAAATWRKDSFIFGALIVWNTDSLHGSLLAQSRAG
jgi:hypothetical protein